MGSPTGHSQQRLHSSIPEPSLVATCLSLSGEPVLSLPLVAGSHCLGEQSVSVLLEVLTWMHFRKGLCSSHGGVYSGGL